MFSEGRAMLILKFSFLSFLPQGCESNSPDSGNLTTSTNPLHHNVHCYHSIPFSLRVHYGPIPLGMRNVCRVLCDTNDCSVCPDAWRSQSAIDGFRNGDANSSSLAAKGFRSVRPNLQDKKTLSQVKEVPLVSSLLSSFYQRH